MNNDNIYNQSKSSLEQALQSLNNARNYSQSNAKGFQIDNNNGVALNTTPISNSQVNQSNYPVSDNNWFNRTIGTLMQFDQNVARGFYKVVEGAVDYTIGGVVGLFDSDLASEIVKYDVTDTLIQWSTKYSGVNAIYEKATGNQIADQSYVYDANQKVQDIIIGVEQGIGSSVAGMVSSLAAGPTVGLILYGVGAAGESLEETLNSEDYNNNYWNAYGASALSGTVEAGVEALSSVFGKALNSVGKGLAKGGSKIGKWLENGIGSFVTNPTKGNVITNLVGQFVSEGSEEVISELVAPAIKAITTDDTLAESYQKNFSAEQLLDSFTIGGLSALALGGTGSAINAIDTRINNNLYSKIGYENIQEAGQLYNEFISNSQRVNEMSRNDYITKQTEIIKRLNEIYNSVNNISNINQKNKTIEKINNDIRSQIINGGNIVIDGKLTDIAIKESDLSKLHSEATLQYMNEFKRSMEEAQTQTNKANKLTNLNIEISQEQLYDENGNKVNAQYNPQNNTITFSSTISATNSFNEIASHELAHYFKDTNETRVNEVMEEIINIAKKDGSYTKQYDELKGLGYKENEINEEIFAKTIQRLFSKNKDFKGLVVSRSVWEKIHDKLVANRKQTSDSKLRAMFAEAISKWRNDVEVKSTTEKSTKEIKKSISEENKKEVIEKKENEVDRFIEDMKNNTITYVDRTHSIAKAFKRIANINRNDTTIDKKFKSDLKALTDELASAIRINGKTLSQYYELEVNSKEYKSLFSNFKKFLFNEFNRRANLNGYAFKKELIDDMITRSLNNVNKQMRNLVAKITESKKVTREITNLINGFKKFVESNKIYKKGTIPEIFQKYAKDLSKLKFISDTQDLSNEARTIIAGGKFNLMNGFFNNEKVIEMTTIEIKNNEYLQQCLTYIKKRYDLFSNSKIAPAIDTINEIEYNEKDYPALAGMTEAQVVRDILTIAKKIVSLGNKSGKINLNGEELDKKQVTQDEFTTQDNIDRENKFKKLYNNQYILSLIDPHAYFKGYVAVGNNNSLFSKIYDELQSAQDEQYKIKHDLNKELIAFMKDKNNKETINKLDKEVEFLGKKITYDELVSIYLTLKNEQSHSHIISRNNGGLVINRVKGRPITITSKEIMSTFLSNEVANEYFKKKSKYKLTESETKTLYDNMFKNISDLMDEGLNKYTEIISRVFKNSGETYSKASDEIYGHHFPLNENYYILNSNPYAFAKEIGNIESGNNYINNSFNPSFAKAIVKNASNALKISSAYSVTTRYVNQLSSFATIGLSARKISRFLNTRATTNKIDGKNISLSEYMNTYVDKNFTQSLNNLLMSMQGINYREKGFLDPIFSKIRGLYAKFSLGANIKVVVSQFMSYPMALSYISQSSMIKGLNKPKNANYKDFNWLMENNSYIRNRYEDDANVYNAEAVGSFTGKISEVSDFFMKPISLMDKFTLSRIWNACQIEAKFDTTKAMELFEKVARNTQPQYDPLGNGAITRSSGEVGKTFLMFTSVPRKYLSRLVEATINVTESKKGTQDRVVANKELGKVMAGFTISAMLMTTLTTLFKTLKGDYDDDEKEEIIKDIILNNFGSNIMGMFPVFNQIYNKFVSGYDISLSTVDAINDLLSTFESFVKMFNTNISEEEQKKNLYNIAVTIGMFTGLPIRNIYNDLLQNGYSIFNRLKNKDEKSICRYEQ